MTCFISLTSMANACKIPSIKCSLHLHTSSSQAQYTQTIHKMKGSTPSTFFFYLLFISLLVLDSMGTELRTYIVHVERGQNTKLANSVDDKKTWYKSFLPTTIGGSSLDGNNARMIHMYEDVMSGFAARLTEDEVSEMSRRDGFVRAYPSRLYSLQTTHTPTFLGLDLANGIWDKSDSGKGIIIGLLDTGAPKDHPSFRGDGMPPPPSKWKGGCESNFTFLCNNKLIGARVFLDAANANNGGNLTISPIDAFGHGTHTASTAGGAAVPDAQLLGNAKGVARGMAPQAHLAMYKVCYLAGCEEADMLAAMDAAIADGVDVLSISIGGGSIPFHEDFLAIGSFRAIQKGVFVSCAAGNGGPDHQTLTNEAPWILTVAASITDRSFRATVTLGNGLEFDGQSLFQPQDYVPISYPLVHAGANGKPNAAFCGNGSLEGLDVKGKIVLCEVGGQVFRADKGMNVKIAGGTGMILMNQIDEGIITRSDAHVLPASHISYLDGLKVKEYIYSSTTPTAKISFKGTVFDGKTPSPAISYFSSRGPSLASPGILKPDITGPGVSIIAAWPFPADPRSTGFDFNIISGTSMSTPHLGGIAALIKSMHPGWSPAAIKSAIMTTAEIYDRKGNPIVDEKNQTADLFAIGAGHVNPNKASDPGLVYDLLPSDYIPYLCGLYPNSTQVKMIVGQSIDCASVKSITEGELNYPSISVPFASGAESVAVERTVKNVGEANSKYWVEVDLPIGVSVTVEPKMLQFTEMNEEIKFKVTFTRSMSGGHGSVSQGYLKWVSNDRTVRSPISITFN